MSKNKNQFVIASLNKAASSRWNRRSLGSPPPTDPEPASGVARGAPKGLGPLPFQIEEAIASTIANNTPFQIRHVRKLLSEFGSVDAVLTGLELAAKTGCDPGEFLREAFSQPSLPDASNTQCGWSDDDDGNTQTDCGEIYCFEDGWDHVRFCTGCGGLVREQ